MHLSLAPTVIGLLALLGQYKEIRFDWVVGTRFQLTICLLRVVIDICDLSRINPSVLG